MHPLWSLLLSPVVDILRIFPWWSPGQIFYQSGWHPGRLNRVDIHSTYDLDNQVAATGLPWSPHVSLVLCQSLPPMWCHAAGVAHATAAKGQRCVATTSWPQMHHSAWRRRWSAPCKSHSHPAHRWQTSVPTTWAVEEKPMAYGEFLRRGPFNHEYNIQWS